MIKDHKEEHRSICEETSSAAHQSAMQEMAGYDGAAFEPEVGISWLEVEDGELMDVVSIPASQLKPDQCTLGKLDKDVWAKKHYRARSKNLTDSIYLTDYTQIPRGRIFIDRSDGSFIVKVGSWIHQYEPMLTPLIKEEFNLKEFRYDINTHWDLGHGWSEHDFNLYAK